MKSPKHHPRALFESRRNDDLICIFFALLGICGNQNIKRPRVVIDHDLGQHRTTISDCACRKSGSWAVSMGLSCVVIDDIERRIPAVVVDKDEFEVSERLPPDALDTFADPTWSIVNGHGHSYLQRHCLLGRP